MSIRKNVIQDLFFYAGGTDPPATTLDTRLPERRIRIYCKAGPSEDGVDSPDPASVS
jgi:hypothetical protein